VLAMPQEGFHQRFLVRASLEAYEGDLTIFFF
jgi:hypothetical protein